MPLVYHIALRLPASRVSSMRLWETNIQDLTAIVRALLADGCFVKAEILPLFQTALLLSRTCSPKAVRQRVNWSWSLRKREWGGDESRVSWNSATDSFSTCWLLSASSRSLVISEDSVSFLQAILHQSLIFPSLLKPLMDSLHSSPLVYDLICDLPEQIAAVLPG